MSNGNQKTLAVRIAHLLEQSERDGDASVAAALSRINDRLDRIESQLTTRPETPKPEFPKTLPVHPSQQRFIELLADEIIGSLAEEKACPYEPAGKPCDHCSMCNSRGF